MSAFNRKVKLTVINDIICPNCGIGQHELLSAISYCQEVLHLPLTFEVEFMPFRLIPTTLLDENTKVPKDEFFTGTFGKEKYDALQGAIAKWADEKKIPIAFKGMMSQSTRAHRLSRKAYLVGGQEKQLPLLCALFKAFLEDGKDIADPNVLSDIAQEVGVFSKEEVRLLCVSLTLRLFTYPVRHSLSSSRMNSKLKSTICVTKQDQRASLVFL
ncbi:hypothetical protein K435DRAFT_652692 [Dendrothele bispora CBS 962.96]|uniref:DSBA-like thioredoxin domain-containing protein n=1 Tax=Dendrothele bispora (strain CBS 962.96) TaxID=1314807 RepID=A0A4S8MJR0_DENBC|nr:hypothetical protein K435DRAFT_652692 [Dendrothele bispora CBS 962.96]